jgi:hypothetical protein
MRRCAVAGVWLAVFFGAVWIAPDDPHAGVASPRAASVIDRELVQGKPVAWWARRAVQARKDANARGRRIRQLRRAIAGDTTIQHAIDLAAIAYQVPSSTLSRKASCESTGGSGYDPSARNLSSGTLGLFQFKPSTWRSTPFARFSPYDPLAAALAAGWMHNVGRGDEWTCR